MFEYPHMCRDEHVEIGHSDSEHEMCPLCLALSQLARLRWTEITPESLPTEKDELLCVGHNPGDQSFWGEIRAYKFFADDDEPETFETITGYGWTHHRPINAPDPPSTEPADREPKL